jgi:hypothetical protein
MTMRHHATASKAARLFNIVACMVSVLTLLTFPLQSAHQFTDHFRIPEVRRSIERHTPIAQPESETAERIPRQAMLLTRIVPMDAGKVITPISDVEPSSELPLSRLLSRLKLGAPSSSAPDPLL